jgi:APA family basic amino acid/polyamine antiporter
VADAEAGGASRIRLFDATMLVAGTMIGSGIFIVSADTARDVGAAGWLLLAWLLAGVMTLLGALCYAELASMIPAAGGQYVFLREAFGPLWGFLYGWTCFLVIQTGSIAAVAVAFAKFLGVFLPAFGTDAGLPSEVAVASGEAAPVVDVVGFWPDLRRPGSEKNAWVLFAATNLHWRLTVPGWPQPIFEMEHFVVTAGQLVAVAVIAFLTWLNCQGLKAGKLLQNVMTVAKIAALGALIFIGLFLVASPEAWHANSRDWWGGIAGTQAHARTQQLMPGGTPGLMIALMVLGGAMVGPLFAADAWNNITFTAGETAAAERTLPRALLLGTGLVVSLYLLTNVAFIVSLPVRGQAELAAQNQAEAEDAAARAARLEAAGADAAHLHLEARARASTAAFYRGIDGAKDDRVAAAVIELLSPDYGAKLLALAVMISTFGCVNGMILMGARLYWVMARDQLFFRGVGKLNRRGVPAVGLVWQGVWSIVLVFTGTYSQLLDYVIFAVLLFYVLTVIGLLVLRRRVDFARPPFRVPGGAVLPGLYLALCTFVCLDLLVVKPMYTWPGLLIVLAGVPAYFAWRRRQRQLAPRT